VASDVTVFAPAEI